jgi:hypothetical protein
VLFGTRGTGIVSTEAEVLTKTDADPVSAKGFAEDTAMLSDEQRAALIAATWPWPACWIWSERPSPQEWPQPILVPVPAPCAEPHGDQPKQQSDNHRLHDNVEPDAWNGGRGSGPNDWHCIPE